MTLEKLKECIEKKIHVSEFLLFECPENTFVAEQYLTAICKNQNFTYVKVNDFDTIISDRASMFYVPDNNLYVKFVDKLEDLEYNIHELSNCAIIATKVKKGFDVCDVITIPKLEEWQIKDYIYSNIKASDALLNQFYDLTHSNMFRLQSEMDKITIFNDANQETMLNQMFQNNAFSDIYNINTFDLVNAICQKNISQALTILKHLEYSDITPHGLVALLYLSFKKILLVQLTRYPTQENTGIPDKQIYAIQKHSMGFYSKDALIQICLLLSSFYSDVRLGKYVNISDKDLIYYIIMKILLKGYN